MTVVTMVEYGQLPAVRVTAPDGAQATVALFGAHLLSWRTADGKEHLFCSARSALDGSKAIRGGVPVIFPQFNARGDGPRHGFARTSTWRLAGSGSEDGRAWAELVLAPSDLAAPVAQAWPHAFELRLRFTLGGPALDMDCTVRNPGTHAFPFGVALHTYFDVGRLDAAGIEGLQHCRYTDHQLATLEQQEPVLRFTEKTDHLYQAPPALTLRTADGALRLEQQGYSEWVVWNPGAADAAALADMADDEYLRFVCIEPARVDQQQLAPGSQWVGRHRISRG
ncbi:MAG: D-hexose-6-phosphate mutarotase [Pseudomonadota bacterium]